MERIKISDLRIIKEENQIPGNFTSVIGEYYIPQISKTGFYKLNGCMLFAKGDEDYRELVSSKIMNKIGFEHADILLAKDEQNGKGCLSVNILKENESFVEPDNSNFLYTPITNISDFIKRDLEQISTIKEITAEDLRKRKEYLLKYLFVSALISNTDIKMDNMFIIKNSKSGEFRNPEYYDMGVSFLEGENRRFFGTLSSNQIIEQLYELYPSQIVPFGKMIQDKLQENDIEQILSEGVFEEFSNETKESIRKQLLNRISLIKELNSKEKNQFLCGTNSLHEVTKNTNLSLMDRVRGVMSKFKDKIIGRNRDE